MPKLVAQILTYPLEREFDARAGILLLLVRSSGSFGARAGLSPIQYFLCSVGHSSVGLDARAEMCECCSSVELDARAGTWFCKSTGSAYSMLEREFGRSNGESTTSVRDFTFWITFLTYFSFLTFKNRPLRVSLSLNLPSL